MMYRYNDNLKLKICLIERWVMEILLNKIVDLRKQKFFVEADLIRDQLIELGYHWKPSPPEYYKNFKGGHLESGHTIPKLLFEVDNNGASLRGYVHMDEEMPGKTLEVYLYAHI